MQLDSSTVYAIGGSYTAALLFLFGWLLKIIKAKGDIEKTVLINRKDIENLKEKSAGLSKKIEEQTVEIGLLKIAVQENGIISRSVKDELKALETKFDRFDIKLDRIIMGIKGN